MFDHVTIRVPNLTDATPEFAAVLNELEVKQTMSTPSFSAWGNFALTQAVGVGRGGGLLEELPLIAEKADVESLST